MNSLARTLPVSAILSVALTATANDSFESNLRNEFAKMASSVGVSAKLVIDPQGRDSRSEPDGTVFIGLAPFGQLADDVRMSTARFYVAHELWHQVQFQKLGVAAAKVSDEVQRLNECQADLMGAALWLQTAPSDFDFEGLKAVTDLAYSIGVPVHLTGEHPAPEQRRTAVRYGFTYGVTQERFLPQWRKQLGAQAPDFMKKALEQVGFREGMSAAEWSFQQCKMVTHFTSEALAGISTSKARVDFNKDPNAPFVVYNIPYQNTSARPIRLSVYVQSMMVARSAPKDISKRVSFALQQYVVEIAPGETFTAAGTLPWYGDVDYYPILEYAPNSSLSLVAAEFTGAESEGATCLTASQEGGSPLARELRKALIKFAPDADTGFKSFRTGAGSKIVDSIYYDSNLQIPGASETEIELEQGGAARVDASLYSGKDEQLALKTYERYRDALLNICPVGVKYTEKNRGRGLDLTLPFSRKTQVNLYVYNNKDKGTYRVVFNLNAAKWQ